MIRYVFAGLLSGILLNFFILLPHGGGSVLPEWHGSLKALEQIEPSPGQHGIRECSFPVKTDVNLWHINNAGKVTPAVSFKDYSIALSGNGRNYVQFLPVGKEIEFLNSNGDRFWKIASREFPYLSYNGKLIFLLNGDNSKIRIIDNSGNEIGVKEIPGRFCTAIAFSDHSDFGGIGFLNGSFFIINQNGEMTYKGVTPAGTMVKDIVISGNGAYAAVHFGSTRKDYVGIVDIVNDSIRIFPLGNIHVSKSAMHVASDGATVFFDNDVIIRLTRKAHIDYALRVAPKRQGYATLSFNKGIYTLAYVRTNGESRLLVFKEDGTIVASRAFPSESFLSGSMNENLIFLRGSDNVFCYSFHRLTAE